MSLKVDTNTLPTFLQKEKVKFLRCCGVDVEKQLVLNFVYMILNISSSVGIVMSNKWIFHHHKFEFGTTLTVVHFFVTFVMLEFCSKLGLFKKTVLPLKEV
ncbi:hypothetical protein HK099_000168, partial [Clydaea vesicula]